MVQFTFVSLSAEYQPKQINTYANVYEPSCKHNLHGITGEDMLLYIIISTFYQLWMPEYKSHRVCGM